MGTCQASFEGPLSPFEHFGVLLLRSSAHQAKVDLSVDLIEEQENASLDIIQDGFRNPFLLVKQSRRFSSVSTSPDGLGKGSLAGCVSELSARYIPPQDLSF